MAVLPSEQRDDEADQAKTVLFRARISKVGGPVINYKCM